MKRALYALLIFSPLWLMAACGAMPHQPHWPEHLGVEVPQVQQSFSYYDEAIACMSREIQRLSDMPSISMAVTEVPDESGQVHMNGDQHSTGHFLPRNSIGAVITPLRRFGTFMVLDYTEDMWRYHTRRLPLQSNRIMTQGKTRTYQKDGKAVVTQAELIREGEIKLPNILVKAQISALDFHPGTAAELTIWGVGGGAKVYYGRVEADGRLVDARSGDILASSSLSKNIFGMDGKVDIGRFFGNLLVSFSMSTGTREAMARAVRTTMEVLVVDLIHQFTGITACRQPRSGTCLRDQRSYPNRKRKR